jgi:alpha,alpha-trehalase
MADHDRVLQHIDAYWPRLVREATSDRPRGDTLIPLPRPYLVPSDGPMFREMYYWDSYFISLGLVGTAFESLIAGMAENMADLFRRFGIIPNASRYYFLSRSQPPFFMRQVWLAYELERANDGAKAREFLAAMMPIAEAEHDAVWMGTGSPHDRCVHAGLSRYYDVNVIDALACCESGWDHSTRCDGSRWLRHLPVDLNAILHDRERLFQRAAIELEKPQLAAHWGHRADERRLAMHRLMWDEPLGFFFDYDFDPARLRRNVEHPSLAGFFPLWSRLASVEQAARMVRDWLPRFLKPGGLVTTLRRQEGCQWDAPNGWAPLQWIVARGLEDYGFIAEAGEVRRRWCAACAAVFEASGSFWEKYNVEEVGGPPASGLYDSSTARYGNVSGFGWTNAVFRDFALTLRGRGHAI